MKTRTDTQNHKDILPVTQLPTADGNLKCPSCKSIHFKKAGIDNRTQRYQCKHCKRNFRDTSNSRLKQLHKKHLIEQYLLCMQENLSLRKTAKRIGISLSTAFRWRHLLLNKNNKPATQCNSLNISHFHMPISQKGAKRPIALKKQNQCNLLIKTSHGDCYLHKLSPSKHGIQISQILHTFNISPSNIYSNKKIIPGISTITHALKDRNHNNIQRLKNDIEEWLSTFRGVATKYLQNYWNWYATNAQNKSSIGLSLTI